jgi:hypothetical protein
MAYHSAKSAGVDPDISFKTELVEMLDVTFDDIHELEPDNIIFNTEYSSFLSQQLHIFINQSIQLVNGIAPINIMVRQKMFFIENNPEIYVCWETNTDNFEIHQIPKDSYHLNILFV